MADQNQPRVKGSLRKPSRSPEKPRSRAQTGLAQLAPEPGSFERGEGQAVLDTLLHGPDGAFGGGTVENQAALLGSSRLQTVQRQAVAAEIGREQGNKHLQRVVSSLNGPGNGQTRASAMPKSTIPRSAGPAKATESASAAEEAWDEGLGVSGPPSLAAAPPPDEAPMGATLQPKYAVSQPGDRYEEEADRIADTLLRMPDPAASSSPEEGKEPETIQPSLSISRIQPSGEGVDDVSDKTESQIASLKGTGEPLPPKEQTFFEDRMGQDFSDVRIHKGSTALQTAQDLNARAYTVGSDIAFGQGEYQPGTTEGRRLMAHELTHVVQQGASKERVARRPEEPDDERKADGDRPKPGSKESLDAPGPAGAGAKSPEVAAYEETAYERVQEAETAALGEGAKAPPVEDGAEESSVPLEQETEKEKQTAGAEKVKADEEAQKAAGDGPQQRDKAQDPQKIKASPKEAKPAEKAAKEKEKAAEKQTQSTGGTKPAGGAAAVEEAPQDIETALQQLTDSAAAGPEGAAAVAPAAPAKGKGGPAQDKQTDEKAKGKQAAEKAEGEAAKSEQEPKVPAEAGAEPEVESGAESEAPAGGETGAEVEAGVESEASAGGETGAEVEADVESEAPAGGETGAEVEAGAESEAPAGGEAVAEAAGEVEQAAQAAADLAPQPGDAPSPSSKAGGNDQANAQADLTPQDRTALVEPQFAPTDADLESNITALGEENQAAVQALTEQSQQQQQATETQKEKAAQSAEQTLQVAIEGNQLSQAPPEFESSPGGGQTGGSLPGDAPPPPAPQDKEQVGDSIDSMARDVPKEEDIDPDEIKRLDEKGPKNWRDGLAKSKTKGETAEVENKAESDKPEPDGTSGSTIISEFDARAIQAKLDVSQPGDPYEVEADRVAESVMQSPDPQASRNGRQPVASGLPQVHHRTQPKVQRFFSILKLMKKLLKLLLKFVNIEELQLELGSILKSVKLELQKIAENIQLKIEESIKNLQLRIDQVLKGNMIKLDTLLKGTELQDTSVAESTAHQAESAQKAQAVAEEAEAKAAEVEEEAKTKSTELETESAETSTELETEAKEKSTELAQQTTETETQMRDDMTALDQETTTRVTDIQQEVDGQVQAVQSESESAATEVQAEWADLEAEASAKEQELQAQAESMAQEHQDRVEQFEEERQETDYTEAQAFRDRFFAYKEEVEAQWTEFQEGAVQFAVDELTERWGKLRDKSTETWTGLRDTAQTIVTDASAKITETWQTLNEQWSTLKETATTALADLKTSVTETWQNLKTKVTEAWQDLKGRATQAWQDLKGQVTEYWQNLKSKVTEFWQDLKSKVTESLDKLKNMVSDALGNLKNLATDALNKFKDMGKQFLDQLKQKALQALMKQLAKSTGMFGIQTAESATATVTSTAKSIPPTPFFPGQVFVTLASLAKTIATTFGDLMKNAMNALKDLKDKGLELWNNLKNLGQNLQAKLQDITKNSLGKLKDMGTKAFDDLKQMGTQAWEDLKSIGTDAWNNLKDVGTQAWNNLKDIGTQAWNNLKDIGTQAWNNVKDLGKNLQDLAQETWGTVQDTWQQVKGTATQAFDDVKQWGSDIVVKVGNLAQTVQTTLENNWSALSQNLSQWMPNLEGIWQAAKTKIEDYMAELEAKIAALPGVLSEAEATEQQGEGAMAEAEGDEAQFGAEAQAEEQAGIPPQQEAAESADQGPVDDQAQQDQEADTAENAQAAAQQAEAEQAEAQASTQATSEEAASGEYEGAQAAAQSAANEGAQEAAETAAQTAAQSGVGGAGADAATQAAQAAVQSAFERADSAPDKAPASAEEDTEYGAVTEAAQTVAQEQQTHEPAQGEADEAQAAAESPASEIESKAEANQVGEMEQTETPEFDSAGFKQQLMDRIAALTPKSTKEADEFKEQDKLGGIKGELQEKVGEERQASEGPLEEATQAAPDTGSIEPKPVTPLEPGDPGQAPAEISAEKATPKAKGVGEFETPLQESNKALDQQMVEAEITEEQLQKSNEPEFQAALEAKAEAQTSTQDAPGTYRQFEEGQLTGAESEAVATAQEKTQAMHDERIGLLAQVDQQQVQSKGEDEKAREKVASDIQKIYDETKSKVETSLEKLDEDVAQAFDAGAAAAEQSFEEYVDAKVDAYKERRYGGWLGWARWAKDKLLGMPAEVNTIYEEGRDRYLSEMEVVIDKVVAIIGKTLSEAKAEIARGKQRIQDYVNQLPEDLKQVGQQAADAIQSQFDQLEQSVESKQTELIDTLAQKYQENLQAIDARIEEMKEANKGLVDKAIDAVGGVIQTILELKDLLLSVLAKAGEAVMLILKDPIGFVGNLIEGIKQGLNNFIGNIGTHLKAGFIEWLTGSLSGAGITLPETWDLKGIFSLVMQVLGLTWDNVRSRAVGIFGERVVGALETGFEIFVIVREQGLTGLWEWVKDKLNDIKQQVFDGIQEMLITQVIKAGIQWLVGILGGPAGAFIKAAKAIYDIVMWFINNAQRLMSLINSIIDSVVAIASGNVSGAAKYIEDSLAKFIPTAIGFLASLLGIGDLAQKVRTIIQKIQQPINTAIDYVLNLVKGFVSKIAKMLGFGDGGGKEGGEIGKEVSYTAKEEEHKISVSEQGQLMWSGNGQSPLATKLTQVGEQVNQMSGEEKGAAQSLLGQAQSMEGSASAKASSLATKMKGVKKLGDEEGLASEQKALEAEEDALAGVLSQLFEKVGGGSEDHEAMVQEAIAELKKVEGEPEDYETVRKEKETQAEQIEKTFTERLEPDIALTITFADEASDKKDMDLDFTVVIAPNDSTGEGSVTTTGVPPEVGTYGKLKGSSGENDQEAHHVPPKGLLGWIVQQAKNAESDLDDEAVESAQNAWLVGLAGVSATTYNSGNNLAAISVHKTTHIKKDAENPGSDVWRIHWGKETAKEVFRRLKDKDLPLIYQRKYHKLSPEEKQEYERLAKEADEQVPSPEETDLGDALNDSAGSMLSTQFFKSELNLALAEEKKKNSAEVDNFKTSLGSVAKGAAAQAHEAVSVALEHSTRDGSLQDRQAAIASLKGLSAQTWNNVKGVSELGIF